MRTIIKQSHAPFLNCTACCAAMLTGHTVEEVHAWIGNEPGMPMSEAELLVWAIKHGYWPSVVWAYGDIREDGSTDQVHESSLPLHKQPISFVIESPNLAVVGVVSQKDPRYGHNVLWADGQLWDPAPYAPDNSPTMEGYKVLSITPFAIDVHGHQQSCKRLEMIGPWTMGPVQDAIREQLEAYR